MYLTEETPLIKGREGINLPKFPDAKSYRKYGKNILEAMNAWTKSVLAVNEVPGGGRLWHPHRQPEQLILPRTSKLPLLVVRSTYDKFTVSDSYKPNSNHQETGYLIPNNLVGSRSKVVIEAGPSELATSFTPLFTSSTTGNNRSSSTIIKLGTEESYYEEHNDGWGRERAKFTKKREEQIRPLVDTILDQMGYSEAAFSDGGVQTLEEYRTQVCEQFDPAR